MKVTVYSTVHCAVCPSLMKWLDSKDVKYTKVVTDEDPKGMEEFMAVNDGMISVPFSVVEQDSGETVKIAGFDRGKFEKALA